jgi:hypothetical protein
MSNPVRLSLGLLKRSGTCGLAINRNNKDVVMVPVYIDGTDTTLPISYIIAQRAQWNKIPPFLNPRHTLLNHLVVPGRSIPFREVRDAKVYEQDKLHHVA